MALGALDLVKNPWTVAVNRANKTAMTLAASIQRSNLESVVLVGHSLVGRVLLNLATALAGAAGTENEVRVEAVHLLGAAIGQDTTWDSVVKPFLGLFTTTTPIMTGFSDIYILQRWAEGSRLVSKGWTPRSRSIMT